MMSSQKKTNALLVGAGWAVLLLAGFAAVMHVNRWHFTAPATFLVLGWVALVVTAHTLWRSFLEAVLFTDADDQSVSQEVTAGHINDLQREKRALVRAIKDCEFDRDMGKMSDQEAHQIIRVYRARAIDIIREVEGNTSGSEAIPVRERIEMELATRLGSQVSVPATAAAAATPLEVAAEADAEASAADPAPPSADAQDDEAAADVSSETACGDCGTLNDIDAVFCKKCGKKLQEELS